MRELLSKQNIDYMERAREVAEKYVRPQAAELDRTGEYGWEILEALKSYELTGVWIPEEYGGKGGGVLDLCLIVEQISRACGGVGVSYAVNALGSFPIILGGTDEQKEKYLPSIASGESLIAFGLSEKASGSDAGSLRTTAIRDGDDYVLNGHKKWNTNGGVASVFTIYALTEPDKGMRGISAFIHPRIHSRQARGHHGNPHGVGQRARLRRLPGARFTAPRQSRGGRLQEHDDDP